MSAPILTFTVPGEPIPQGSAKAFVRGHRAVVTSDNPRMKGWRSQVAAFAVAESQRVGGFFATVHQPVTVAARCYFTRPVSCSVKKRPWHVVRPDVDKLARCLGDALTGVLYHDDAQVVAWTIEKRYAEPSEMARAEIEIRLVEDVARVIRAMR